MAKPWARLEIGYLDHPKFQALNATAICLWHEGKNYCDRFHTDGLIPLDAAKRFRFGGKKSIVMLTTPIDFPKPDGSRYAPLWEHHPVGFKMHDYLDHNDCREVVLDRLAQAEESREVDRERLRRWRAAKKTKRETPDETLNETPKRRFRNGDETLLTETETLTETSTSPNGDVKDCAETPRVSAPVSPVLLTFPTDGQPKEWPLTQLLVDSWQESYTSLNVLDQCRRAREWVLADPKRRKTAGGMRKFLVNWFNTAVDRVPRAMAMGATGTHGRGRTGAPPPGKYDGIEES